MANYNGRRAPNVSQYIAGLNSIPSQADLAAQNDFPDFEDSLAMFTNTEFYELPGLQDFSAPQQPQQQQGQNVGQENGVGFGNETNFQFSGFPGYPHPVTAHSSPQGLPPTPPNGMVGYPPQAQLPAQPQQHTFPAQPSPQTGDKRKAPSAADLEEASRAAAEEDKRRRNTAASARFRVKKKQREQALEKTAKEMSEKVQVLEARVGQLEMENKWLKGLITEKNIKGLDVDSKKEGEQGDESERSSEERKKGVGTGKEAAKIE